MADITFALRGAHITLDALLKATGLAHSGGAAKMLIGAGGAVVNGETDTRRGRKLRAGDVVQVTDSTVRLQAATGPAEAPGNALADTPGGASLHVPPNASPLL